MRWLSTLLGLLLLLPVLSSQCDKTVIKNCEFKKQKEFCGWNNSNWALDPSEDGYAYLSNDTLPGFMKSKEQCVSSKISHCLRFRFRLKRNETDSLSVSIAWPSNQTEFLLWKYSTKTKFTNASVPLRSDSEFALIIRARSPTARNNKDISVDRLKYENESCTITPPSATPPLQSPPSPSEAGAIIGVVGGIVVVLVAVVVVLVVCRKRIPLLTLHSATKNNCPDDSGYRNTSFASAGEDHNEVNTTRTQPSCTNCQDSSTPRICSGMSSSDYSVIDDIETNDVTTSAFQPVNSLYCKALVLQDASSVLQTSIRTHVRQDCTDAESDGSVHTGLRVDSPAQQSAGGASVYEPLQEQKDVHVYSQVPGVYQN